MKKLTYNLAAKVTATVLFVLALLTFLGAVVGVYFLAEYDFYEGTADDVKKAMFEDITRGYANRVFYEYFPAHKDNYFSLDRYQEAFSPNNTNFLFVLKNEDGDILLSNYSNQEYQFSRTYKYYNESYSYDKDGERRVSINKPYTMDCFVSKTLTAKDRYSTTEYWINIAYPMRYSIIAIALISLIGAIILFIFLMCSAGRRRDGNAIIPNGIDKIPLDLFIAALIAIALIEFAIYEQTIYLISFLPALLILSAFMIIDILLLLLLCMSFATRCKIGGWWRNTVIYHIFKYIFKAICKVCRGIKYLFRHIPILWKAIIVMIGLSVLEFIAIAAFYDDTGVFLLMWILEKMILYPAILFIVISLRKLQDGGQKIADGDLSYHVDTRYMFWDFKGHAENLNSISKGLSKAVEERMKSERLKTELITNVSHDIKTPLTSIVNYVDLIKKEEIEDEKLKEYIDVLDRQSARLKKLIDDLFDASKASTGSMPVNMAQTEIGVLLAQTAGEYEEKLRDNGLELILKQPEDEIFIMADGRLLWRVFDNLMNNICKYAQPSTRAYLNLEKENGQAVIVFRNISKYALNITSDELMERFVRGDSSRNTEGSGLGLSIAKSLVELQDGQMDVHIDGDLFKVVLQFKTVDQS